MGDELEKLENIKKHVLDRRWTTMNLKAVENATQRRRFQTKTG